MSDKYTLLEEKVSQVLERLDGLKTENTSLQQENTALKGELSGLRQEFHRFRLEHNDQNEAVRSKLATLLSRIEELERMGL